MCGTASPPKRRPAPNPPADTGTSNVRSRRASARRLRVSVKAELSPDLRRQTSQRPSCNIDLSRRRYLGGTMDRLRVIPFFMLVAILAIVPQARALLFTGFAGGLVLGLGLIVLRH